MMIEYGISQEVAILTIALFVAGYVVVRPFFPTNVAKMFGLHPPALLTYRARYSGARSVSLMDVE